MERKIRILGIFWAIIILELGKVAFGQGFVSISDIDISQITKSILEKHKTICTNDRDNDMFSEYSTICFNSDSFINLPTYSFKYSGYLNENLEPTHIISSYNCQVIAIAKNYPMGSVLHYLYADKFLFITSPQSGVLLIKNLENNKVVQMQIRNKPFGLCYSNKRNKLFISLLKSRYIMVINIKDYQSMDSILLNGSSGRYMALSRDQEKLYIGIRSAFSISKVDIEKRKLENFVKTGNIPGPIYCDNFHNLYCLEMNSNVLSKFDDKTLRHYESTKIPYTSKSIFFDDLLHILTLTADSKIYQYKDTLGENGQYYLKSSLDSLGRYTWIINSYTNPKWAVAKKLEFEAKGIKTYISCQNDGYYRLCAGLYKNQEEAVQQKTENISLFSGSWLLTIHPHKF